MPKYGLLIDYDFCIGCHVCEVACKQEHMFNLYRALVLRITGVSPLRPEVVPA